MTEEVLETRGWDAISAAFETVYPGQEPKHLGTLFKFAIGGPDPLDGISIYRSEKQCPHWHYVSYGFTELYGKETDSPDVSGYGFEITFRLPIESEDEPPVWPAVLMQNLARYVFGSGNVFLAGHHVDLNGPINLDNPTEIKAIVFAPDVDVQKIDSPNGKFDVLQIVGITLDELNAAKQWNTAEFTKILSRSNPYLITALHRKSILTFPEVQKEIDDGIASEGSNLGYLMVQQLDWTISGMFNKSCKMTIPANAVEAACETIPNRISHAKPFMFQSKSKCVSFEPGDTLSYSESNNQLTITMTAEDANRFAETVKPTAGEYTLSKFLSIIVTKVAIKDSTGKVVETIG